MDFFTHNNALVEPGAQIGSGTRVWAFAHILPGARIGSDCNICDNVFIENDVKVGDRVTIKCGVQLWDGTRVGEDVFIGPNVTFTNDRFPRSKKHRHTYPETVLEAGCSIGGNATILPGIRIGRCAMVGAGAVVTRPVPPNAIVVGNPAQITGYTDSASSEFKDVVATSAEIIDSPKKNNSYESRTSRVRGVSFHNFPLIQDLRGDLSVGEFTRQIPFSPKRYFLVFNVQNREIRGDHAHKECAQFLLCVAGSCRVVADDGTNREEFLLNDPTKGLHLPKLTWSTQYKYSNDGVLLVFASDFYDSSDYIRNYEEFLKITKEV